MHVFMIFTLSQILPIASPHLATLPTLCSSFKNIKEIRHRKFNLCSPKSWVW